MGRTWLEVGKQYTSGKDRKRVTAAIESLEWHPPTAEGPMSPVLMLQAVVSELRLPKVSALAWGGGVANVLEYPDGPETATYTVLGVEANYTDGRARVYVLDTGVAGVPLASDFPVPVPALPADHREPDIGRFWIGAIVATPGAVERMEHHGIDARRLLAGRLLSVYDPKTEGDDTTIWITTEADRSTTTILRPEDY